MTSSQGELTLDNCSTTKSLPPEQAVNHLCEIVTGPGQIPVSGTLLTLKEERAVIRVSSRSIPAKFIVRCPALGVKRVCIKLWSCNDLIEVSFVTKTSARAGQILPPDTSERSSPDREPVSSPVAPHVETIANEAL